MHFCLKQSLRSAFQTQEGIMKCAGGDVPPQHLMEQAQECVDELICAVSALDHKTTGIHSR